MAPYGMNDFRYDISATYVTWVTAVSIIFKFSKGHNNWGMGKFNTHRYLDVPRAFAWAIMESGSFFLPAVTMLSLYASSELISHPGFIPLMLFTTHYACRVFVDPLQDLSLKSNPTLPLHIAFFSLIFTSANGLLQARDALDMVDPVNGFQSLAGIVLWLIGFFGNRYSDAALKRLKDHSGGKYVVPRNAVFDIVNVAAPNYFFELVEMLGYVIAANFHLGSLLFFFSEVANLTCRAHDYHGWYKDTFGNEYTKLDRKVMVPRVW